MDGLKNGPRASSRPSSGSVSNDAKASGSSSVTSVKQAQRRTRPCSEHGSRTTSPAPRLAESAGSLRSAAISFPRRTRTNGPLSDRSTPLSLLLSFLCLKLEWNFVTHIYSNHIRQVLILWFHSSQFVKKDSFTHNWLLKFEVGVAPKLIMFRK